MVRNTVQYPAPERHRSHQR